MAPPQSSFSDVIAAVLGQGARFSVTGHQDAAVRAAIASIAPDAWTTSSPPRCLRRASAALGQRPEVAKIDYTAFTSKPKPTQVHARSIVRRVKEVPPTKRRTGRTRSASKSALT